MASEQIYGEIKKLAAQLGIDISHASLEQKRELVMAIRDRFKSDRPSLYIAEKTMLQMHPDYKHIFDGWEISGEPLGRVRPRKRLDIKNGSKETRRSEVWEVRSESSGRPMAIKFPRKGDSGSLGDEPVVANMIAEARGLQGLKHKNIVEIYCTGNVHFEDGEQSFPAIVEELIEGCTLEEWRANREVTAREAVQIAFTIARALAYARRKAGLNHFDIKPTNIMVKGGSKAPADESTLKLIDFASYTIDEEVLEETSAAYGFGWWDRSLRDIASTGKLLYVLIANESMPDPGPVPNEKLQKLFDELDDPTVVTQGHKAALMHIIKRTQDESTVPDLDQLAYELGVWLQCHFAKEDATRYSLKDKMGLLYHRCRNADDPLDHSILISLFSIVTGILLGLNIVAYCIQVSNGISPYSAFQACGTVMTTIFTLLMGAAVWMVRGRISGLAMYAPLCWFGISTGIMANCVAPIWVEVVTATHAVLVLLSVQAFTLGTMYREWRPLLYYGIAVLLVSIPFRYIVESLSLEPYAPTALWLSCLIGCPLFAFGILRAVNNSERLSKPAFMDV